MISDTFVISSSTIGVLLVMGSVVPSPLESVTDIVWLIFAMVAVLGGTISVILSLVVGVMVCCSLIFFRSLISLLPMVSELIRSSSVLGSLFLAGLLLIGGLFWEIGKVSSSLVSYYRSLFALDIRHFLICCFHAVRWDVALTIVYIHISC